MKKEYVLFVLASLLFALYTQVGCSGEETTTNKGVSLNERKKPAQTNVSQFQNRDEKAMNSDEQFERSRESQLAIAEACMKKFRACTDKCDGEECEALCLDALRFCEKNLPTELQTLK